MRVTLSSISAARSVRTVLASYGYSATQVGRDVLTDCPTLLAVPAIERQVGLAAIDRLDLAKHAGAAPNRAKLAVGTTASFPRRCQHPAFAAVASCTPEDTRTEAHDPLTAKRGWLADKPQQLGSSFRATHQRRSTMLVRRVWPSRPTFENPFSDFDQMRREVLRLFDTAAGDNVARAGSGVFPPMNVTQDDDAFYLRAETPGISRPTLSISALRNRVSHFAATRDSARARARQLPPQRSGRKHLQPHGDASDRDRRRTRRGQLRRRHPHAQAAKGRANEAAADHGESMSAPRKEEGPAMASEARTEMNRAEKTSVPTVPEQTRPGPVYAPAVDIFENESSITVFADMPGVKAEDLKIDLRESVLS